LGRVTISSGVASFQENTASFEELIKMADDAMYRAKEDGRNRVCSA
jgi:diguanylate cyclase (GGDEF)-like protein